MINTDWQLWIIVGLTFVIHLIGTLAYSVRIAGTRTGRIAVSFSLFNILILVSRTSNSFLWLVGSRLAGTLIAQVLLIPAATLIAYVAQHL